MSLGKKLSVFQILALSLVFILASFLVFLKSGPQAKAIGAGPHDNVNLHLKIEVSGDHGLTWLNYSGTESPGNQTLNLQPGESFLVRIKVWNDAGFIAADVTGYGAITNSSYLANYTFSDLDIDHDTLPYDGNIFSDTAVGFLDFVPTGGSETGIFEGMLAEFTLSNSFPAGETILLGQGTIADYTPMLPVYHRLNPFGRAYAAGIGKQSAFRISVQGASTQQNINQTSSSESSNLPDTGKLPVKDLLAKIQNYLGQ